MSERDSTGKPLSRNISIIRKFAGITSATKVSKSFSAAASAKWARRIVPRPWSCISLAMAKATSARLAPSAA